MLKVIRKDKFSYLSQRRAATEPLFVPASDEGVSGSAADSFFICTMKAHPFRSVVMDGVEG